jgi:TonB family protein
MPDLSLIQSVVNALGWTLIHFLWQGLAIAAVYWMVARVTRPDSALIRYWTGMAAFAAAGLVPAVTFVVYFQSGVSSAGQAVMAVTLPPVASTLNMGLRQILRLSMEPAIPAVVVLWALGVGFLSLRAVMGWMGAQRLVHLDTEDVSGSLQLLVNKLMARLGVEQAVRVLESGRVRVPTVVGWLKPVILLPAAVIARMPEDQLEMVIAHELGHIRRYDYLFNLFQVIIETLFFYHPAIRWLSREVRQEREHCVDDLVVDHCARPVLYAKALANLEVLREPVPAIALSASGGDLVYRVRRIIRHELPGNHSGFAQLATMMGVAVMVTLGAYQGMEMRRHLADSSAEEQSASVARTVIETQSREAWVSGVGVYSGLAAQVAEAEERLALERENARVKTEMPVPQPVVVTEALAGSVADAEIAPPPATGVEDVFNAPGLLEGNADEALMLAGTFTPSPRTVDAEPVVDDNRSAANEESEVMAETVVAPVYPFKARRKRLDGYVKLEFSLDSAGKPENIKVVDAQPADIFEKSAITALKKWQFRVNEGYSDNQRLYQSFDFGMEETGPFLPKRERRCDITGSRICGLQSYNDKN